LAKARRLERELASVSLLETRPNGTTRVHPALAEQRTAMKCANQGLRAIGLMIPTNARPDAESHDDDFDDLVD
jgi:hypothetical protein